ncbi:hypothetical protein [Anabaena catenula]|uniref:PEP-CTERM sorting domain-containing protein n=1 Tax=Anabaena catenula FACHB-362 TaxID=2692877 RepID=A0ABR8J582_9NOST|nr:hypothetical protein [Anabaena catenula]MBD2692763.1 hypothetical protein [Anabaena catenula FACHB-362]
MLLKTFAYSMIGFSSAIALTLGNVKSAFALSGFTGAFDVNNFTLTSTSSSGNITEANNLNTSNAAAGEGIIFGPDNNDSPGYTGNTLGTKTVRIDWLINITSASAGNISFRWAYDSLDSFPDDEAGYFVNSTYTTLGTIPVETSAAPIKIPLVNGDTFGFWVSSNTNTGGYGYLTISNFDATPVPFDFSPSTATVVFLGGFWGVRRFRKSLMRQRGSITQE